MGDFHTQPDFETPSPWTKIATLQARVEDRDRTIDLLEANARVQAKLLADTGRRVDELTRALEFSHDSLRDWLAFAVEELSEFDVDDECSGERLCPKCESSGCIKLKIDNARRALSVPLEQSGSGK